MRYGWLLYNDLTFCEDPARPRLPSCPAVGQRGGRNRLIESLRSDLYRVFTSRNIRQGNSARSEGHKQKRSIFAFCSLRWRHWVRAVIPSLRSLRMPNAAGTSAWRRHFLGKQVLSAQPNVSLTIELLRDKGILSVGHYKDW